MIVGRLRTLLKITQFQTFLNALKPIIDTMQDFVDVVDLTLLRL